MRKDEKFRVVVGAWALGIIAFFIGFILMGLLVSPEKSKECLSNEEAWAVEYKGFDDLDFCSKYVVDRNGYLITGDTFLYDCENVKKQCESSDYCYFWINGNGVSSSDGKCWKREFIGVATYKVK